MSTPPPQPFYFGPPGEGLFAWLHRPSVPGGSAFGLVICNPFGFEEVCAHRSLRHIGMSAAAAGVPALRFDYAGCGNSQGDEFQPQRLLHWVRSIHRAIEALKQASGLTQVCLLGLRLGATLATLAAVERDDVAGLVAIAPVVRGSAYLRELTVLSEAGGAASSTPHAGDGPLESAGFVLTREASESLARVDLRALDTRPAPRVVLVDRDDMPSASKWLPVLERLGAQTRVENWAGYAAMMRDPQRARVPQEIVDGVVACLTAWQPASPLPARAAQPVGSGGLSIDRPHRPGRAGSVRETAVHVDIGSSQLFGILTAEADARGQPAVLMLTAGSVHAIGPNRLWVRLAREWALRGVTVLRMDISGIGDSPTRPGAEENVVYSPHAAADIAAALSYLRGHLCATECHVLGLCSGAYHALKAAVAGQAIASATMINPLIFHWKDGARLKDLKDYEVSGLAARYSRQLLTSAPWKKLLRGEVDLRLVGLVALRRLWTLVYPPGLELARALRIRFENDLAEELASAAGKGIHLHFVFAANAPGFELLRLQGGRAVQRMVELQQISLDFVPDADHTFTRTNTRERLVALLNARMLAELTKAPAPLP